MNNIFFSGLITLTIFSLMLTIGVNEPLHHLGSVWRQRATLLRSLLAVVVLLPAIVVALLWVFDLSPATATGLAVLAAAPGAPLTTKRAQMAGADLTFVSSLQLTLAMLAVVFTPLALALFQVLFDLTTERVAMRDVIRQVATVTFLPVVIGLLLQRFAPKVAAKVSAPLQMIANGLFALMAITIVALLVALPDFRALLAVGWQAASAIIIMVIAALILGHALGGPKSTQRSALAIANVARNVGLALFVLGLTETARSSIPTVLVYALLGTAVAVPYSIWTKRLDQHQS